MHTLTHILIMCSMFMHSREIGEARVGSTTWTHAVETIKRRDTVCVWKQGERRTHTISFTDWELMWCDVNSVYYPGWQLDKFQTTWKLVNFNVSSGGCGDGDGVRRARACLFRFFTVNFNKKYVSLRMSVATDTRNAIVMPCQLSVYREIMRKREEKRKQSGKKHRKTTTTSTKRIQTSTVNTLSQLYACKWSRQSENSSTEEEEEVEEEKRGNEKWKIIRNVKFHMVALTQMVNLFVQFGHVFETCFPLMLLRRSFAIAKRIAQLLLLT